MTKTKEQKELSKCHSFSVRTHAGAEGTNHYICDLCNEACDLKEQKDTIEEKIEEILNKFDSDIKNPELDQPNKAEILWTKLIKDLAEFARSQREEAVREERKRIDNEFTNASWFTGEHDEYSDELFMISLVNFNHILEGTYEMEEKL